MTLDRPHVVEMINVHRVLGDKQAIIFLKNSEKDFVEGLFFKAKRFGSANFYFKDIKYDILRNKDYSFVILPNVDQDVSLEQFA